MAFKINADKFAYSASPEKVSESYAAELAKKLVADEADVRKSGYAALENKIEVAAAEEAVLRSEADRVLDERISLEASKISSATEKEIKAEATARKEGDDLLRGEIPSKTSQLENDSGYLTAHQDISGKADKGHTHTSDDISLINVGYIPMGYTNVSEYLNMLWSECGVWSSMIMTELKPQIATKADIDHTHHTEIIEVPVSHLYLSFHTGTHNVEYRGTVIFETLSLKFGNGEYPNDFISGLSFDSGATPTAVDYTGSGILNWVGTDCTNADGLSIFQPSANTHYDIVFYFNGTQFIGLVNGFAPATGNVVSE